MAARRYRKLAILAKIEEIYGNNINPSGASNAMQLTDVTVTPLEGEDVRRDLMLPYYGDQGFLLTANRVRIEGAVEMAGSGTAGTPPAYGPLLRACGLAEIVTVGQQVEYKPISEGFEAVTMFANLDGTNHVAVGSRGSFSISHAPRQIPRFRFVMTGLVGQIADTALPTVNLSRFIQPLVASNATSIYRLHAAERITESFSFDLGNQVEPRLLIGKDSIEIVDRRTTGSAVLQSSQQSERDWFGAALNGLRGSMLLRHGTTAGNIVEIEAGGVQVGRPTYGNSQGTLTTTLPLTFTPVAGDDDFTIRVR